MKKIALTFILLINMGQSYGHEDKFLVEEVASFDQPWSMAFLPDGNFLGFSRLQLYEMYVPRNFKSIESFYINKIEFDFQNHIRSLWRASKKIKSKNNIEFLCGKNLYKRLKLKKIPEFINIIERIDLPKDYGELLEKKI